MERLRLLRNKSTVTRKLELEEIARKEQVERTEQGVETVSADGRTREGLVLYSVGRVSLSQLLRELGRRREP